MKTQFGVTPDGARVDCYRLASTRATVNVLTYGGIIQAINVPDREGRMDNVVLGFDNLSDYLTKSPYFGCLIGRYANRIARGTFVLEGRRYQLAINDGPNSCHGGVKSFSRTIWDAHELYRSGAVGVELHRASPDGEEGFPGTLAVKVTYWLDESDLDIEYEATTDKPTIVCLTNHSYFNLGGEGRTSTLDHELLLNASRFTPVDETLIPTGEIVPVAGGVMDFTRPVAIGERVRRTDPQLRIGRGYDHNWVLDKTTPGAHELAAQVRDPKSGRVLEIFTTEPGIQFYSGNFLDGTLIGTSGRAYRQSDGVVLEPQHFPDSPNQPTFPSTVLLPGEVYRTRTRYRFTTMRC